MYWRLVGMLEHAMCACELQNCQVNYLSVFGSSFCVSGLEPFGPCCRLSADFIAKRYVIEKSRALLLLCSFRAKATRRHGTRSGYIPCRVAIGVYSWNYH